MLLHWFALQCVAGLQWSLLAEASRTVTSQRASHGILPGPCHLYRLMTIWWSLVISSGLSTCCWFMFGVSEWTRLLISWQWRLEMPPKTISKQVHTPVSFERFIFPLPLVGGLEGRLKPLRTLIRVCFEKSKSAGNSGEDYASIERTFKKQLTCFWKSTCCQGRGVTRAPL